jgi:hypothetical protein
MRIKTTFLINICLLAGFLGYGQNDSLKNLLSRFDEYRSHALQEKLFVHTDRSFYLAGELIWLKIYDIDGTFHRPLDISKIAYVEIIDSDNKPAVHTKIPMSEGFGNGSLFLPASLAAGHYILRAYTHWMRNFSPDFYYQQRITIVNPFASLGLKAKSNLPQYDIQLFPEGGHLIEEVKGCLAFRAVDQEGHGIDFDGYVLNENNDTVSRFKPLKFGMGRVSFLPQHNHQYRAIIRDGKGRFIKTPFPSVAEEGYSIHVRDTAEDKINITVESHFSVLHSPNPWIYFVAQTRLSVVEAKVGLVKDGRCNFQLDKKSLPSGICHLTIFNDHMHPVSERLYFKRPTDQLSIHLQTDKSDYAVRDKINMTVTTNLISNLSLAVYRKDSLASEQPSDITTFVWLTSELPGNIESPAYYLESNDPEVDEATDNLMLTHGWTRYRWDKIKKAELQFAPEINGHIISGKAIHIDERKPATSVSTFLSVPGKDILLFTSKSDELGKVQYEVPNLYGDHRIVAQANRLKDSTCRIEIMDPFSDTFSISRLPRFDLSEKMRDAISLRSIAMQVQDIFVEEKNHPKPPKIDSTAFYGTPNEKYRLDDYTRFPTMEEVMREYVPGVLVRKHKEKYHFLTFDRPNMTIFKDDPLVLLDGVPIFDTDKIMAYDPRKVERLDVMARKYYLGHLSFEGIVSYTTYHGDLLDFSLDPEALSIPYEGLQLNREFFSPRYETVDVQKSRLPDSRSLLFWAPSIKSNGTDKNEFTFYTSDIPGSYVVEIQGMSAKGLPGKAMLNFKVTPSGNP